MTPPQWFIWSLSPLALLRTLFQRMIEAFSSRSSGAVQWSEHVGLTKFEAVVPILFAIIAPVAPVVTIVYWALLAPDNSAAQNKAYTNIHVRSSSCAHFVAVLLVCPVAWLASLTR